MGGVSSIRQCISGGMMLLSNWSIALGRRLMLDFGFASFVEKFEEYYGKPVTKALLGLLGITAAALCLSLLTSTVVIPVYETIYGAAQRYPTVWELLSGLLVLVGTVMLFSAVVASLINGIYVRQALRDGQKTVDEARYISEKAEGMSQETHKLLEEAKEYREKAKALFAQAERRVNEVESPPPETKEPAA